MRITQRTWSILGALGLVACQSQSPTPSPAPPTSNPTSASTPASIALSAVPPVEAAIERRLFVSSATASSFLHSERAIHDRYHPNYAFDGDPLSAWNEGAASSGAGEWISANVTPTEEVTSLRLRVMNGYQKTPEIFTANARAKSIVVTLLPGNETATISLEDKFDWQEVTIPVTAKRVEKITFTVQEVYEGAKHKDLCLSEIEIFAAAKSKDDPIAAKSNLDLLNTWKQNQTEALSLDASPLFVFYVTDRFPQPRSTPTYEDLVKHLPAAEQAQAALLSLSQEAATKKAEVDSILGEKPIIIPDSLKYAAFNELLLKEPHLLTNTGLTLGAYIKIYESKRECDEKLRVRAWYVPKRAAPSTIELISCRFFKDEYGDRDTFFSYDVFKRQSQVLRYDDVGRLRSVSLTTETDTDGSMETSNIEIWFEWGIVNDKQKIVSIWELYDSALLHMRAILSSGDAYVPLVPASVPSTAPASAPASAPAAASVPVVPAAASVPVVPPAAPVVSPASAPAP